MSDSLSVQTRLDQLVDESVRAMKAYHVADAQDLLKLDAMENPYTWDSTLRKQWLEKLEQAAINRYPDPSASGVQQRIRKLFQLRDKNGLIFGNGSDELIQLLIMLIASSGKAVLAPSPSFVMYKVISDFLQVPFIDVPLQTNFDLDIEAMLAAINEHQPGMIFLACPNNPTGNAWSEADLIKIIEASEGFVVIDEAYTAFTDRDHLSLMQQYPHVLVMRTFSKVGLAGLRLGMLMGDQAVLNEVDKLRLPYNINVLTQLSVEFALDHFDVLEQQSQQLRQNREALINALADVSEYECFASEANFVTLRCANLQAKAVFETLKSEYKILIKCLDGGHPLLENCLRLTVGTEEENNQLIDALKAIAAN